MHTYFGASGAGAQGEMLEGEVAIRCAHGDTTRYQLPQVQVAVGEKQFLVEAGVSDILPTSVLLGTDVPEMVGMLRESRPTVRARKKLGKPLQWRHELRLENGNEWQPLKR